MLVLLSGIQDYRGEIRTVGRVGEVLGLEADSAATGECSTLNTLVACGEVCGVELHAGFCGVALQRAAALRIGDACSKAQLAFFFLVQHVVVVETMTKLNLLIVCVDVLTESFRGSEVER